MQPKKMMEDSMKASNGHSGLWRRMGMALMACCIAASWIPAGAAKAAPARVDEKAKAALQRFAKWLQNRKQVRFTASITMEMKAPGMENKMTTTQEFALDRPARRFAMLTRQGFMKINIVCDGKKAYSYVSITGKYTEKPAPKDLEELLKDNPMLMAGGSGAPGPSIPAILLRKDTYSALTQGADAVTYVARETLDGRPCDHLKMETEAADLDMWVRADAPPLLVKIVPDPTKILEKVRENAPGMKGMKMSIRMNFSDWTYDQPLPADLFVFKPPPGVTKSASLFPTPKPQSHPLVGKVAPDFSLDLLDGGAMRLSKHWGKDIVVLDFWATWCPPCRRALPIVAKVTAARKDKGVVFYAVDQGEKPEQIRKFLQKQKIDCQVALDSDKTVGNKYKVSGIPQTVIIGKDGKVQAVHIGYNPAVEQELARELDSLIEGKSLVDAKKKSPGER